MRIVIVDDDEIVLMSLKTIIETSGIEVVGVGRSGEDAISLFDEYMPDILLSDIRMEGLSGIDAAVRIVNKHENAKILFLTTFSDDEYIISAISCGAKGYILKQDFEGIIPALKAVFSGQSVFGGNIVEKIPTINKKKSTYAYYEESGITPKEYEIITLVAEGMNNKEIANELFLSEGTVRNYLSIILEKLQMRDRTQLVVDYYKNN